MPAIHKKKLFFAILLPVFTLLITYLCIGTVTQRMLEVENGQILRLTVRTSPLVRRIDLQYDFDDTVLTVRDTPFYKHAVLIRGDQKHVSYLDLAKNKFYVEAYTIENNQYCVDMKYHTLSREDSKYDYHLGHAFHIYDSKGNTFTFP